MLNYILLALFFAQAPTPLAVDSVPSEASSDAMSRAQAWLLATYPALQRGDVVIRMYGDAETLRAEVAQEPAAQLPGRRSAPPPVLVVDLHAAKDGRVEAMTARGGLVQSAALDTLKAQILGQPSWTDDEIATAITSAGGKFGPAALSRVLSNMPSLATMMRTDAVVTQSTFIGRDPRGPVWVIDVASATRTYRVTVEPITGQLIGIAPR